MAREQVNPSLVSGHAGNLVGKGRGNNCITHLETFLSCLDSGNISSDTAANDHKILLLCRPIACISKMSDG